MDKIFEFDKRLWTLDVSGVEQCELPEITNPDEDLDKVKSHKSVKCYVPDMGQLIQIAFIIWQVATFWRGKCQKKTSQFEQAEGRIIETRRALTSLLLPMFAGDEKKAHDFCAALCRKYNPEMTKYINGWEIIPRPSSVWVDKENNGIFLCQNKGRILVGLNPTNYVFMYNQEK